MSFEYTVIWPFDGSAVACAGANAVCPWNGMSYCASTIFAALANAASGVPFTDGPCFDVGVALRM